MYAMHPYLKGEGPVYSQTSSRQRKRAYNLARKRPLAARRSPVNYALLFHELGTGKSLL